jgi:hypothetical protein
MQSPYLELGPSSDPIGTAALLLGGAALVLALWRPAKLTAWFDGTPSRTLVTALAIASALASFGYLQHYLHGGPRIVDATSYFLEGRALAEGKLAFDVPAPSASFRGRFTLFREGALSVIFPPGYPLVLAAGFLLRAPLLVGPLLGGLLVAATYFATRELLHDERAARVAAVASLLSAALRYHTADTMSHGLSALLLITALGSAARGGRLGSGAAGLLLGLLLATRPVTGVIGIALSVLVVAWRPEARLVRLTTFGALVLPGVLLVLLHQHAATGSLFHSTQLAYYAVADGPPGCFAWGFGSVGCRFEHGDFVKRELAGGFGIAEALRISGLRLALHVTDLVNLAPLFLLVPWALVRHRRERGVLILGGGTLAVMVGYAPFYYPGSYPGAGARFFADALPLEHALLGLALSRLGVARFLPAGALLGFALHAVHAHVALAERDGGRPMFEPRVLERAGVRAGLVFVGTDHGFALGHDPAVRDPRQGIVVAREHGDGHDAVLVRRFGFPPTYRYVYSAETGRLSFTSYAPEQAAPIRLEAEAEWPPLGVTAGWVHPDFRPCLSKGRGLHLRATPAVSTTLELVSPEPGDYDLVIGWLADPGTALDVAVAGRSARLVSRGGCQASTFGKVSIRDVAEARFSTTRDLHLDYLELDRPESKKR